MSSRLQRDEALENEDTIDEMQKKKQQQKTKEKQHTPALPYAKAVGRPGTGSCVSVSFTKQFGNKFALTLLTTNRTTWLLEKHINQMKRFLFRTTKPMDKQHIKFKRFDCVNIIL